MSDLLKLRKRIDEIDENLVALFAQRMDVSAEIARYKQQHNLPVYDPDREKQKLQDLSGKVTKDREPYITTLYSFIFELSRFEQERILNSGVN